MANTNKNRVLVITIDGEEVATLPLRKGARKFGDDGKEKKNITLSHLRAPIAVDGREVTIQATVWTRPLDAIALGYLDK